MKKSISRLLLVILLTTFVLFASAGCFNNTKEVVKNGIIYIKVSARKDGESDFAECYYVSGCKERTTTLNILSEVNGLPVLGFERNAFNNNMEIKEVVIPDTITSIALNVVPFAGCNNIEKLTLATDQVENLFVAYGSGNLNVTDPLPQSLKVIYLSNACTEIRAGSFRNCKYLQELHIPASITKITDGTNFISIGVNGNTPDSNKFKDLPFLGCANLTIYCEATTKPTDWGPYWNYISQNSTANVVWNNY